jgi:diaminopimelate epimerase
MSRITLPFWKVEATGNDFVYLPSLPEGLSKQDSLKLDPSGQKDDGLQRLREWAPLLCDRHKGIGADGVLWTRDGGTDDTPIMGFLNPDGSDAGMCGNGGRCFAALHPQARAIEVHGVQYPVHHVETGLTDDLGVEQAGERSGEDQSDDSMIALTFPGEIMVQNLGPLKPLAHLGDVFQVFSGTEHVVVCNSASQDELQTLRLHNMFQPKGTNANVCLAHEDGRFVRTFERGVEALTKSCGTGVLASALAWWSTQPFEGTPCVESINIHTDGGKLTVGTKRTGEQRFVACTLQGPAGKRFKGEISLPYPTS